MFLLRTRFCSRRPLAVFAGLLCIGSGAFADESGQSLETAREAEETEYVVPAIEYQFDQGLQPAAPLDYRSAKASGLPMALRHRVDAIWSGASLFSALDETASDYPMVAEVQYRLRRSPWSDPERMVEARLLDGTRFRSLVTRQFDLGRTYQLSAAIQHSESLLANGTVDLLEQTEIPVEARMEVGERADLLVGLELNASKLQSGSEFSQSNEQALKVGVASELAEGFYGQLTAGARRSELDGGRSDSGFEAQGALIWQVGADSQYSLTFDRSTRPSLVADAFVDADTLAFAGDFTLSDMWSAYYGVSKSWAELEKQVSKEILGGEIAVSFSPNETIQFSGGYIYRSGSLNLVNEDEAERIIRLSASVRY